MLLRLLPEPLHLLLLLQLLLPDIVQVLRVGALLLVQVVLLGLSLEDP